MIMNKNSAYNIKDRVQEYDKDRYGGPFGQYLENLEIETFLSMMNPKSETILDLGAGTGKLSIPLVLKSKKVLSVDSSADMLRVAGLNRTSNRGAILRIRKKLNPKKSLPPS